MAEVVTGSLDALHFWEVKTWNTKRTVDPFPSTPCQLSSITWNQSNSKLAVVPKQGEKVAICDFQDNNLSWNYLTHQESGSFTSGSLLRNSSRYFISGSTDSTVRIWDLKHRTVYRSLTGHSSSVTDVVCSHNDHWIVSGGQDGSIIVHSVDSSMPSQVLQSPSGEPKTAITRLCFSHVEKGHFGSVSEDGVVCVWSVESQRLLTKYPSPHTKPAMDLCFSPSNNMLMVTVGMDSRIKCQDLQTRKIVTEVTAPTPLTSVTMLKDGSTLLVGSADGKVYIYELRSVKYPRSHLLGHKTAVTCIAEQSYSKKSKSRSSKGKRTPSSTPSSSDSPEVVRDTPTNSTYTASPSLGSSGLTNHLPMDEGVSPHVGPGGHDPVWTRGSSMKDSVNITPYVTTQPAAKGSAEARGSGGEVVMVDAVLQTPASNKAQVSSIFSPLDPSLVTPLSTKAPVPVAAATPLTTTAAAATPLTTPSCATSNTQSVSTTSHSHPVSTAETSSIFSPLDSGPAHPSRLLSSRQPVVSASPLLIAHTQASRRPAGPYSGNIASGDMLSDPGGGGGGELKNGSREETDGAMWPTPDHTAMTPGTAKPLVPTSQSQLSEMLGPVQDTASVAARSSTHSVFSSLPDSATTSSGELLEQAIAEQRNSSPAPPPSAAAAVAPPISGVQMKYLENMIKEAHEETQQVLHQDNRALSIDSTKFFYALMQQSASQHAVLVEKIEKLSEELKQVQELVHQYMPKH